MLGLHLDTNFSEKSRRQDTAGTDDDAVVRQAAGFSVMFENHSIFPNLFDVGTHQHFHLPIGLHRVNFVTVFCLGARERVRAIGESHRRARLIRNTVRCLERAVTTAYDKNMLTLVLLRVYESIHDLCQLLTRDSERTRRTAPANGQEYGFRDVARLIGLHVKTVASGSRHDADDSFVVVDFQASLAFHALPEFQ